MKTKMDKNIITIRLLTIYVLLSIILGCSSRSNPVQTNMESGNLTSSGICAGNILDISELPKIAESDKLTGSNTHLLGIWNLTFDREKGTLESIENRELSDNHNITQLVNVSYVINSYDPYMGILEVDVTITNKTAYDAYDLRLIVYTDNLGNRLFNADDWTSLYDIGGGAQINPFKAYAKSQPNRKFSGNGAKFTERLQLYFPAGFKNLSYAISASWPGNCSEPYEISNFIQGNLYDQSNSQTDIYVDVYDWQNNVNSVNLWCPSIMLTSTRPFTKISSKSWKITLSNEKAVKAGNYACAVIATSSDSGNLALYDVMNIVVKHTSTGPDTDPPFWDTTKGITNVVLNGYSATVYWGTATDEQTPPVKYLIYMDIDSYPWNEVPMIRSSNTPYTFHYLQPGRTYWFGVRCEDSCSSPNIDTNNVVMWIKTPDTEFPVWDTTVGITSAVPGIQEVTITWGTATDADSPPVEYLLYMDDDSDPWDVTAVVTSSNDPYTFSGLENGATYWFGVRCRDSADPPNVDSNDIVMSANPDIVFNPIDVTPPWLNFSPRDIFIEGNYAYVAGGINGLHIFDVSDPLNPFWVNRIKTQNVACEVFVSNNYAYVADGSAGLQIINIEHPESAYIVKSVATPLSSLGVYVSGNYAYVVDYQSGLQIINIEQPESAYIVKFVGTPSGATGVYVSGNYAYVTDYQSGLQIINIDPPESAYILKTVDIQGGTQGVHIFDSYAYVTTFNSGLQIIDIDPPESAHIVNSLVTGYPRGAYISDGFLYIATDSTGLQIINIESPESAYIVKSVETPGPSWGVYIYNGYAYVGGYVYSGIQIIDIEPQESAYIIKSINMPGEINGVYISDDYAYIAGRFSGVQIIDTETPESAYVMKSVDTPDYEEEIFVYEGYAYVANYMFGLQIIDIDPPESAHIVTIMDMPDEEWGVYVSGYYAYVADEFSGLRIINIEIPESAYVVKTVDTPGRAVRVYVASDYAYVADYYSGLQIIAIDPPESAHIVKSVDIPEIAFAVFVSGSYAYVANWYSGLQIINIDPPESAYLVKSVVTPEASHDVYVSGSYAYVADWYSGFQIIDIDPPESAYVVESVSIPGGASGIYVSDNYAYVAGSEGFRIIKLW